MALTTAVFVGFLLHTSKSASDYCANQREICNTKIHVRCVLSGNFSSGDFYPGRLLTEAEKILIVHKITEYRAIYNKIAIEWNNEFEQIAKVVPFIATKNVEYCYGTMAHKQVFTIDTEIIYSLDRNVEKWIDCMMLGDISNVLRVTDTNQIGCIIYSPELKVVDNPYLHSKYRIFCILNGVLVDSMAEGSFKKCILEKRDKLPTIIKSTKIPTDFGLIVRYLIWMLLIVVIYLNGMVITLLWTVLKNNEMLRARERAKRESYSYNVHVS